MENIIEVENLSKRYDDFLLNDVNLSIKKGSIMGLIGENGAGKTTLIKLILNLIKRDNGTISVFGKDNIKDEKTVRQDIGVVLDGSFFYEGLKCNKIPIIMRNIYKNWDNELYKSYLEKFDLKADKHIKDLSTGMKMKLKIAVAMSHRPKLLMLDECTNGLDPVMRNEVLDIFMDFIQDEEKSILFSTHITSDLEHIADYITFINKGNIVMSKTRDEILENYAVVKCDEKGFENFDKNQIVKYKKNRFNYEILVENKEYIKSKYKDLVVDNITLEDIMVMYGKGVSL